jgi:hypothetical protein
MFSIEDSRKLLEQADLFYYNSDEEESQSGECRQMLNMNDVWGWACADGQTVSDDQLQEVADLFWRYGWCGILYWVSKQNDNCRSEFFDNNRFIDFVEQEEKLRKEIPDSSTRAYKNITYEIGK